MPSSNFKEKILLFYNFCIFATDMLGDQLISISLNNIEGARNIIDENPYTGKEEEGIFIPVNQANVYKTKWNKHYIMFVARLLDRPEPKITHILRPMYSKERLEQIRKLGYTDSKYGGKMYPLGDRIM